MTETFVLLQLEHGHIARLLSVLETQCEQLRARGSFDLDLIEAAVEYFADYPDLCHHPKEDRVFRRLRERDPERADQVGNLLGEHEDMSAMTAGLLDRVRAARQDGSQAELVFALRQFIQRYRDHLMAEEQHFFPAVQASLTDDDWAAIDFDMFDRDDPLFDTATESRFRRLRLLIQGVSPPRPDDD